MDTSDDPLGQAIGFTVGQHIREVAQRLPDPAVLGTHADLLRAMIYELGTQLTWSVQAADRALSAAQAKDDQAFWREIQLFLTFAAAAANFIWASPSRKKELATAFPSRAADIQLLLDLDGDRYTKLTALRDAVIHVDEKLEYWWLHHQGGSMGVRSMNGAMRDGTDFLSWDPETKELWFLDVSLSLPVFRDLLNDLQQRSTRAFYFMLFVDEEEDIDDSL